MKGDEPKLKKVVEGADALSLGISMVVAVLMGVGLGLLLKNWTGEFWTMWIGVFIGVAAAILNIYKVYKKEMRGYDELKRDPRYQYSKYDDDEDDED